MEKDFKILSVTYLEVLRYYFVGRKFIVNAKQFVGVVSNHGIWSGMKYFFYINVFLMFSIETLLPLLHSLVVCLGLEYSCGLYYICKFSVVCFQRVAVF